MKKIIYWTYKSTWGKMTGAIDESGYLKGLWFINQKHYPDLSGEKLRSWEMIEDKDLKAHVTKIIKKLQAYERGEIKDFDISIEANGTDFQRKVWEILRTIPYGTTMTYGQISKILASETGKISMSPQAVGQAVGRNPISVIIPCHRVVGVKGQLTGYAGGVNIKEKLLTLEGASYLNNK